jgi:hypothetical protein
LDKYQPPTVQVARMLFEAPVLSVVLIPVEIQSQKMFLQNQMQLKICFLLTVEYPGSVKSDKELNWR